MLIDVHIIVIYHIELKYLNLLFSMCSDQNSASFHFVLRAPSISNS